jgi:hypothetical protein
MYSKNYVEKDDQNEKTVYYISLQKAKRITAMDKHLYDIENELQHEHDTSNTMFKRIGAGEKGIAKSFAQGKAEEDDHWKIIFEKANKPKEGVIIYTAANDEHQSMLETTPSSTPSYTPEMTPSPVQRAASTMQAQGSMSPEPDESTVINMYFHSYIFLLTAPSFCRDPPALNNAWSSSAKANANPTSKNSLPRTRMPQSFSARITEKEPCMLL